ncbi:MAG: mannose-6-phosphate isomerase, class I [Actinomycetia bacterium]|nr:mannose-6-phosphate isomerase, class I [Actinomycetes bacterium]
MPVLQLENPVRHYAWGSRTVLPTMLGHPVPAAEPWAEIWMGAHPGDPSRLPDGRSLADVVPGLPFLVKLLAAEQPLSIQAHPSSDQARAGFAAEEARGVPHGAPQRSYKDPSHKPELLVALTPVDALCGFRAPAESLRLVRLLGVPRLTALAAPLADPDPAAGLRAAFGALLGLADDERTALVADVAVASHAHEADAGPDADALDWVARLAVAYPADPGVVAPLLLHLLRLEPGQGIFLRSGVLHGYLHGAGVEVQASSDNVLRGGLTPKHVDVPELLRVVRFEVAADPVVAARPVAPGVWSYPVPVADFAVWRVQPGPGSGAGVPLPGSGERIVVCVEGRLDVGALGLTPGTAAFVAGEEPVVVRGTGTGFVTARGT